MHHSPFTIYQLPRPRRGRRGFTLIEMLVVMLIMGLFLGLVSAVAQPDERDLLQLEAERLARLLELASVESSLTGKPIGWTSDGTSYRFWRAGEDSAWSEIRDGDQLRARMLPQGILIAGLRVETLRPQGVMRLEFNPYGLTPAFTIEMISGTQRFSVAASPMGEVRAVAGEGTVHGTAALR